MSKKQGFLLMLAALLVTAAFSGSLAVDQGTAGNAPAETPMPALTEVTDTLAQASAANAALLYRSGGESAAFAHWETALGHVPKIRMQKKVTEAMLRNAVGLTADATPVGRAGIRLQQCYEVPLPKEKERLQQEVDFNLHGSLYADSPLTSVTATFTPKWAGKAATATATVTFDAGSNVTSYSLVSEDEPREGASLDTLMDASNLNLGRYQFTLTATTVNQTNPVTLHSAEVKVEKVFPYQLNQNQFDDNYSEALAFFGRDTSKFLFTYSFRDKSREVPTQTTWRESMLAEGSFGSAHKQAVPYFNKAYEYMQNTYFKVDTLRPNGEVREGDVTLLYDIMDKTASSYVPRFQSNLEYVSHHTLGTAIDVNDDLYPNLNIITNHELIGDDVRDNLEYRGIQTDADGQQYYDFYYSGSYKAYFKRVPKTIVNYLLYELAFYRAGFQWGFYYETACDAMHFMLTENDINKHMDSEVGLRKVYSYIGDDATPPGSDDIDGSYEG